MDNLTHTLFAVTLARTALGRAGRGTTAALVLASNAPDIDIVVAVRDGAAYLEWHRGPTHGPLGLLALGLPAAVLVWLWLRRRDRPGGRAAPAATFPALLAISILGVLLHLAMDFPTSYGSRSLSPFDWHWFAFDWMPIIDIYLLAALAIGLIAGAWSRPWRSRSATIVLALMAANYALRAGAHHQAIALGPDALEPLLPPGCVPQRSSAIVERWPSDLAAGPQPSGNGCLVEMAAVPTFLSPFTWRLIARLPNQFLIHDLNLLDARDRSRRPAAPGAPPPVALHFPNEWTPPVAKAAASRLGQIYLGFSRFPAARATIDPGGGATVAWNDMRFVGGVRTLGQAGARPAPFVAIVRIDASGRIVEERLGR